VSRPPASGPVTGYAVFADGKKVTDVDSPTGDHALIDITKLVGINPQVVTVRTKSRDAQSADSMATPIPRKYRATISRSSSAQLLLQTCIQTRCPSVHETHKFLCSCNTIMFDNHFVSAYVYFLYKNIEHSPRAHKHTHTQSIHVQLAAARQPSHKTNYFDYVIMTHKHTHTHTTYNIQYTHTLLAIRI
jgi:hypothetical protein